MSVMALNVFSQNAVINGFWGLEFGMSRAEVLNSLRGRVPGWKIDLNIEKPAEGEHIYFKDINFAGIEFKYCVMDFFEDQMYVCFFTKRFGKDDSSISDAVDLLVEIRKGLIQKYGDGWTLEDNLANTLWQDSEYNRRIALFVRHGEETSEIVLAYEDYSITKLKELSDF